MDLKAAETAVNRLVQIPPPSKHWHYRAIYTSALILREANYPQEKCLDFALKWAEEYRKRGKRVPSPSKVKWTIKKAYIRAQDKPSRQWYKLLAGVDPLGDFWVDLPPDPKLAEGLKASIKKEKRRHQSRERR